MQALRVLWAENFSVPSRNWVPPCLETWQAGLLVDVVITRAALLTIPHAKSLNLYTLTPKL